LVVAAMLVVLSEIMDGQVSNISTNNVDENVGIMIDIHES